MTKQFFAHLDTDFDALLQARINGGFFHPGEPFKTQEGFAFSAGMEHTLQAMRDKANVHTRLTNGFEVEDDE